MAGNGKSGNDPVILSAARTPQGKLLGNLSTLSPVQLAQHAVKGAVDRSGITPENVNEVILGQVLPAGSGQAVPRQVWIGAGYPETVGGITVNKVCGSGLRTVMIGASAIRAGDGDLYVAGGVESMSHTPFLDTTQRHGSKYGDITLKDGILRDGLWCSIQNWVMGDAAEFIGDRLEVTREEMDQFAADSHAKAHKATLDGCFTDEIVPIEVKKRRETMTVSTDEPIRPDTSVEALSKLRPAFKADGRVTAGNAPGLNDGAAAVVVSSRQYAEANGHQPLARIVSYAHAALDPQWIFYAPVKAIPLALEKAGWTMEDVDLFEVNEAFAAQVLADMRGLERDGHHLPTEKLNIHGGAIAIGHPLGASGARVLVTLVHALQQHGLKRGLAALCLGGGEAVAMAVEME
jgi:acetyl-CoA C-acetyltransferase